MTNIFERQKIFQRAICSSLIILQLQEDTKQERKQAD